MLDYDPKNQSSFVKLHQEGPKREGKKSGGTADCIGPVSWAKRNPRDEAFMISYMGTKKSQGAGL